MVHILEVTRLVIVLCVLGIAVYSDLRTRKIANAVTVTAFGIGLVLALIQGVGSLMNHLAAAIVPFLVLFLFFAVRMIGAGDIKLLCALGSIMGLQWIINCMILMIIAGGPIVLIYMLVHRIFSQRMLYAWKYIKGVLITKTIHEYQQQGAVGKENFPFSIAIAVGAVLSFVLPSFI